MSSSEKKGQLLLLGSRLGAPREEKTPQNKDGTDVVKEKGREDGQKRVLVESSGPDTATASLAEARKKRDKKKKNDQTASRLRTFGDELIELMRRHLAEGLQPHELAAMITHQTRDLVFRSFDRVEPEKKRQMQEKLRKFLANIFLKPLSSTPDSVYQRDDSAHGDSQLLTQAPANAAAPKEQVDN